MLLKNYADIYQSIFEHDLRWSPQKIEAFQKLIAITKVDDLLNNKIVQKKPASKKEYLNILNEILQKHFFARKNEENDKEDRIKDFVLTSALSILQGKPFEFTRERPDLPNLDLKELGAEIGGSNGALDELKKLMDIQFVEASAKNNHANARIFIELVKKLHIENFLKPNESEAQILKMIGEFKEKLEDLHLGGEAWKRACQLINDLKPLIKFDAFKMRFQEKREALTFAESVTDQLKAFGSFEAKPIEFKEKEAQQQNAGKQNAEKLDESKGKQEQPKENQTSLPLVFLVIFGGFAFRMAKRMKHVAAEILPKLQESKMKAEGAFLAAGQRPTDPLNDIKILEDGHYLLFGQDPKTELDVMLLTGHKELPTLPLVPVDSPMRNKFNKGPIDKILQNKEMTHKAKEQEIEDLLKRFETGKVDDRDVLETLEKKTFVDEETRIQALQRLFKDTDPANKAPIGKLLEKGTLQEKAKKLREFYDVRPDTQLTVVYTCFSLARMIERDRIEKNRKIVLVCVSEAPNMGAQLQQTYTGIQMAGLPPEILNKLEIHITGPALEKTHTTKSLLEALSNVGAEVFWANQRPYVCEQEVKSGHDLKALAKAVEPHLANATAPVNDKTGGAAQAVTVVVGGNKVQDAFLPMATTALQKSVERAKTEDNMGQNTAANLNTKMGQTSKSQVSTKQ